MRVVVKVFCCFLTDLCPLFLSLTGTARLSGFSYEGTTTGIDSVVTETAVKNDIMYNIAGQRISAPVSGQIYIMNGKKYIAK